MSPKWVILRREFAKVFSERTILLAVILQVFVAGFSSFLVVGLASLVDPSAIPSHAHTDVGLVGDPDGALAKGLADQGLIITHFADAARAHAAFTAGGVDAIIVAPPPDAPGHAVQVEVTLPDGDIKSTVSLVQVKSVLEGYERELRTQESGRLSSSPLYLDIQAGAGSFAFVYSLLIPLLVYLPVVLSGALAADSLTEEVQKGTLPILLSSPATPADVVEGKLLANALLAPLLTIAWLFLLSLNGLKVPLPGALLMLVVATCGAILLGLLACIIAIATRDRNQAHLTYALGMMVIMAATALLPMSPVNAVARLAGGSWGRDLFVAVGTTVALTAGLYFSAVLLLRKSGSTLLAPHSADALKNRRRTR